ncbi:MAG: hypothetical protein LBG11_07485 [Bifidobacteriaceae bacterium]|jgi:hypothetical protein|nr:hypothetical protein [Bifidobacteriaceae bacterium]
MAAGHTPAAAATILSDGVVDQWGGGRLLADRILKLLRTAYDRAIQARWNRPGHWLVDCVAAATGSRARRFSAGRAILVRE